MAAESEEMTSGFPPNLPSAGDVLETEMQPLPVGPDSADASLTTGFYSTLETTATLGLPGASKALAQDALRWMLPGSQA